MRRSSRPPVLDRQDVERHLQSRDGFAEFGMVSDLLLQFLQNFVSAGDVFGGLGWVSARAWVRLGVGMVYRLPCQFQFYTGSCRADTLVRRLDVGLAGTGKSKINIKVKGSTALAANRDGTLLPP